MKLSINRLTSGVIENIKTLDTNSKSFADDFRRGCIDNKSWNKNVAMVYTPDQSLIHVYTHAQYCEDVLNINYSIKDILFNKIARSLCFIEIDLMFKQIFFSCGIYRSKSIDPLELIAIHIEYELYRIRYSEGESPCNWDPCIPGIGSTKLIYSPPR